MLMFLFVFSSRLSLTLLIWPFTAVSLSLSHTCPLSLSLCSCPVPPFVPLRGAVQENGGLSPAAGRGRHGEDARARLEVCVHVPAGVLQGSGHQGPG